MSDIVIKVDNLSKKYTISHQSKERYTSLRDVMANKIKSLGSKLFTFHHSPFTASQEEFYALKDVSFEIKQGERVGIIGRNGAGKSTLLKILSRITEPTSGRIEISGRVASLLEVGTGFHPELTGRENIFLNGAILGMGKAEIKKKFDEIVAFAEIEKFLDTPVKRYSSGMYVRLAFGVAAHLEPEILVVDEVLAVGDAEFQKKCLGKMGEAAKGGKTVLFVSHNMPMVLNLCQRSILLNKGCILMDEKTDQVIEKYISGSESPSAKVVDLGDFSRSAGNEKAIRSVWTENARGEIVSEVLMGSEMKICFSFTMRSQLTNLSFGFGIENMFGQRIFSMNNILSDNREIAKAKDGKAVFHIREIPLLSGNYFVSLSIVQNQTTWIDYVERAFQLTVWPNDVFGTGKMLEKSQGVVYVKGKVYVE